MKIVFIDDEEQILNSLMNLYQPDYPDSVFFSCSLKAKEYILNNLDIIDLIVSDYKMPNLDGIEVLKELRKQSKDKKFIIYSAFLNQELVDEMLGAGYEFEYISKPGVMELYNLINSLK